jgi:hypothetical protein
MQGGTSMGLIGALLVIFGTTLLADAATIRVRCEQRSNRSKISVDGNDLRPGEYKARVRSGGKTRTSDLRPTVGDEVEFDFDSAPDDIAAGATPIPANFIQHGEVSAKILTADGRTVISDTVDCRVRN